MPRNDKVIEVLNDIIETLQDGVDGYRRAAQDTETATLKMLFQGYADQRMNFKTEVQSMVAQLGGKAENTGSTAAKLHRGWIDLKSTLMGRNDEAILEECENGDTFALKTYEQAQKDDLDLPANVRTLLQSQHAGVQEAYDRIRMLEQQAK